jgi:hypothetical protein
MKCYFLKSYNVVFSLSLFTGFMTNQEKELFNAVPATEFNTYWIPCTWFIYRIQEASKNKKLINEYALETIIRVRNIRCMSCTSIRHPAGVVGAHQYISGMHLRKWACAT